MTGSPAGETGRSAGERETARQSTEPAIPIIAALEPAAAPLREGEKRLELRHISKSFGGVHVLQDVSLDLGSGEVVGLLGDNGAGKSTLIKIITGVHSPDAGEIRFAGQLVEGLTVQRARALGVETVFQERALADQLPLWRNIFMGRAEAGPFGFLKVGDMRRMTAELMSESMGFTSAVSPSRSAASASSRTSTSDSAQARSWACSATTAPASPP
ncbi:MAG: ATP-binding cassette domain-containing protein [Candidatus Limnocylindrales bacterium]